MSCRRSKRSRSLFIDDGDGSEDFAVDDDGVYMTTEVVGKRRRMAGIDRAHVILTQQGRQMCSGEVMKRFVDSLVQQHQQQQDGHVGAFQGDTDDQPHLCSLIGTLNISCEVIPNDCVVDADGISDLAAVLNVVNGG